MNQNQLLRAEVSYLLIGLNGYALDCELRADQNDIDMRKYWADKAERVRALYERILSADSVDLIENDRSK